MRIILPFPAVDLLEKVDQIVEFLNTKNYSIPCGMPRKIEIKNKEISEKELERVKEENSYEYFQGRLRIKSWLPGRYIDAIVDGWESENSPEWGTRWSLELLQIKTGDTKYVLGKIAASMITLGRGCELNLDEEVEVVRLPEK